MSWLDNVSVENVIRNGFVRLTARLKVLNTEFTLLSGNVYYASFDYGPVHTFEVDGVDYTAQTSTSLSAGEFFYDRDANRLYIYSVGAPSSSVFYCAHFYLFFCTSEMIWYEDPTDDTTPLVFWSGTLKTPPSFKITIKPLALGLFPVDPSDFVVFDDGSLNYLLGNASFNRTGVQVWEQLGELEIDNIIKKFDGYTGQRINIQENNIRFDVIDKSINFDAKISGAYFQGTSVDPKFQNMPAMKIWGFNKSPLTSESSFYIELVNIDYNSTAPTTSNNRKFGLVYDPDNEYQEIIVTGTGNIGSSGIFQATVASDVTKFKSGDLVWFDPDIGAGDLYLTVDFVDPGLGNVHFSPPMGGTANNVGNLRKHHFDQVFIVKNGVDVFKLVHGRDYTATLHPGFLEGITLRSTAEANAGTSTYNPVNDSMWCVPSGKTTRPTFNAVVLDETNRTDGLAQVCQGTNVLYDFLRTECGLEEDDIDFDSFEDSKFVCYWDLYIPVPIINIQDYPTRREVLDLMLQSLLLRAHYNIDGKFSISPYRYDKSTPDGTVTKEELHNYSYEIDYSEISKVQFAWSWDVNNINRIVAAGTKDQITAGTSKLKLLQTLPSNKISEAIGSDECNYLHKSQKSILFSHAVPQVNVINHFDYFTARVKDLYGERSGTMFIEGKKIALANEPSEDLLVYRDSIVGLDDATGNSKQFEIAEIEKAHDHVSLSLQDRKAANDKSNEDYWDFDDLA